MNDLENQLRAALTDRAEDVTSNADRVRPALDTVRLSPADAAVRKPATGPSARLLAMAACVALVAAAGIGFVLLDPAEDHSTSDAVRSPIPSRGVVDVDVDAAALRPLDELSRDDVVVPTMIVDGLTLEPTLRYRDRRSTTRAGSTDDSFWIEMSSSPGNLPLDPTGDTERLDIDGVTWDINDLGEVSSAFAEVNDVGVRVISSNVSRDDLVLVLEQLRVGSVDAAAAGSFDVDERDDPTNSDTVYSSGPLLLNYRQVGTWSCWSLFDRNQVEARFGDCSQPITQPDGTVLFDQFTISSTQGDPSEEFGNIVSTTLYAIGTVPTDAIAVEVSSADGMVEQHPVSPRASDPDGRQFFVATTGFDTDQHQPEATVAAVFGADS